MPRQSLQFASAVARGAKGYMQGTQARQDAAQKKKLSDLALEDAQYKRDTRPDADAVNAAQQAELATVTAQNKQLQGKMAKQNMVGALERYTVDSDPEHLNNAIADDPMLSDLYSGLSRIESINLGNETDLRYLSKYSAEIMSGGPQPKEEPVEGPQPVLPVPGQEDFNAAEERAFWEANPELLANHVKTIGTAGEFDYMDMNSFKLANGYYSAQTKKQIESETAMYDLAQKKADYEATLSGTGGKPKEFESTSRFIAGQTERPLKDVVAEKHQADIAGTKAVKLDQAEQAKVSLYEEFGGEAQFFEANISEPGPDRRKAERYVHRIELGLPSGGLDRTDRTELGRIRKLLNLADTAVSGITEETTGFVDDVLHVAKSYFEDTINGKDAATQKAGRSAYTQFRNLAQASLFGMTLTNTEVAAQNRAFGNLKQKLPAVLIQFKEQLEQTKSAIESADNLNDSVLSKYYIGKSREDVDQILGRLDAGIARISNVLTPEEQKELGLTIYGGSKGPERIPLDNDDAFNKAFGGAQ